jgi:hypothetical protein
VLLELQAPHLRRVDQAGQDTPALLLAGYLLR